MKKPSKHVCFEAEDLACIQLDECNATSFSHKMLYFTSSVLACFPVSSGRRSGNGTLWSSQLSPVLRPVPAALPAQSLLPDWLGHCSLEPLGAASCQFEGCSPAASQAQQGQAGRAAGIHQWGALEGMQHSLSGYQVLSAVSSGHSDPKLQGS